MSCRSLALGAAVLLAVAANISAQTFPDRLYYKFDEGSGVGGTTANVANPGVGSLNAAVTGHSLTAGVGQFNGGLVGTSVSPGTSSVDTGWTTALGTGSWTISFWCDVSAISTSTLYYVFGDSTAGSFRCFYNGAAGVGNVMLRGGLTDVIVPGAGVGGGHAVTFVYDSTGPQIRAYLDGALVATVSQAALNINGTSTFKLAYYSSASTFSNGAKLDEFRLYGRALLPSEVAATWNVQLFDVNVLSISQSGPGVGDLTLTLGNLSPTASEGWTLLSADVSGITGTGPFFGIRPDASTWLLLGQPLFDGNPFHFPVPSAFGAFPSGPFAAPPGSVSGLAGLTFDIAVVLVRPGYAYDSRSNVVRYTFQ